MSHFKINPRDIFFILKEQLGYGSLCRLERYRELDETTLDMLVNEAIKFARTEISPLQEIGEKWGAIYENGHVRCAPEFKKAFELYSQNGWLAAARDPEYGGQGFPHMMRIVINDFMYGACQSFNMAPSLTHGAGHLIESFGTKELKELYVANMFSGKWAGTMALTEPNAGSNLAALRTTAYREGDHFKIKGTKIFISWGDHDLTENIIHLVLARIDGAPEGVRGISLFVVPKIRVLPDGSLGEPNDVLCGGVEKKLGLHASPTCQLIFGDNDACIGYLCGQENKGLVMYVSDDERGPHQYGRKRNDPGQHGLPERPCLHHGTHSRFLPCGKKARVCAYYRPSGRPAHAALDEGHGGRHALNALYMRLLVGSGRRAS